MDGVDDRVVVGPLGTSGAAPRTIADLHQDGQIDFRDYVVLADQWLEELLWPQP